MENMSRRKAIVNVESAGGLRHDSSNDIGSDEVRLAGLFLSLANMLAITCIVGHGGACVWAKGVAERGRLVSLDPCHSLQRVLPLPNVGFGECLRPCGEFLGHLGLLLRSLLLHPLLPNRDQLSRRPDHSGIIVHQRGILIKRKININVVHDSGIDPGEVAGKA